MNDGVGIGFRKDFGSAFFDQSVIKPDFVELAPENWIDVGGYWKKQLDKVAEQYPILLHGLSLSIGSPDPIDWKFLGKIKSFIEEWNVPIYSEHLSYSKCDNAHLYDLLPIPFREDAVKHISQRIKEVQDFLGHKLVIEIVSYYTPVAAEMTEVQFINAIQSESDCELLFDINNIYVNGFNHGYNPKEFIEQLDLSRVRYIHMAGHEKISDDLIIDTHGQPIIDPVYDLFEFAIGKLDHQVPILLERDFNIPEMGELQTELERLKSISKRAWKHEHHAEA
ncbi:MAG: DUF692 domain-containing protein [Flavobacteriales bacterium]|jgi:hypothetical protein|nr:DUF692 domain-containing protein [Flavobacteriales bacterium]MBT3963245.1 DUF692 domain-containing protein [Flavobacteriales bacterium]MBT4704205.1 DUF692 domain-containing protein [Flavobacteriales bacterium]MBT5132349.1 DUF692 domain-containing protein [Flavobacteriales bacterium]MBT5977668.1 DUF692 domain-containing protein [Flavobacteriales bacterium]